MQKLVWQNANGETIDLTSGSYGITEWEGFSNASLNIQSQQVPFQDGAVFLDALIEPRELSVTLAMQDNKDLELRYQLRRELIHKLNPKLGEGYLIYTNDFISKRIKCVAQIPLFETHNSNDSGTPKASLSWVANEPYWEDLEDTIIEFDINEQPIIKNEGDVPCQIEMDWFTADVKNGKVTNVTTGKKIQYDGELTDNITISTLNGKKEVKVEKLDFYAKSTNSNFISITYSEEKELFIAIDASSRGYVYISKDGNDFTCKKITDLGITFTKIAYISELKMFIIIGYSGVILTSPDGENWVSQNSGVSSTLIDVAYNSDLEVIMVCGAQLLTSPDGENWTSVLTATIGQTAICYSKKLAITVIADQRTVYQQLQQYRAPIIKYSTDLQNWTQVNIPTTQLREGQVHNIIYTEEKNMFVGIGSDDDRLLTITSQDGATWNNYRDTSIVHGTYPYFSQVIYDRNKTQFFMVCYPFVTQPNNNLYSSSDGVNWTSILELPNIGECIAKSYELNKTVICGAGFIYQSENYVDWDKVILCYSFGNRKIIYAEKLELYLAVGEKRGIATSLDKKVWIERSTGNDDETFYSITYSEEKELFVAVGEDEYYKIIYTSPDGINWTKQTLPSDIRVGSLYDITYAPELELFVACGTSVMISSDGVNWTKQQLGDGTASTYSIIYENDLLITVGENGKMFTSPDGINWTMKDLGVSNTLKAIRYIKSFNLYIVVGTGGVILTSSDLINWTVRNSGVNVELNSVAYDDVNNLFLIVGKAGTVLGSSNGIDWKVRASNTTDDNVDIIYLKESHSFLIISLGVTRSTVSESYYLPPENRIQYLSKDSDIGMNLAIGDNRFRINYSEGNMIVRVKYRQKYIGV